MDIFAPGETALAGRQSKRFLACGTVAAPCHRSPNHHPRQTLDRSRVWPGDRVHYGAVLYRQPDPVIAGWCATLLQPASTAAYVSSWCRLNHLIEP